MRTAALIAMCLALLGCGPDAEYIDITVVVCTDAGCPDGAR